MEQLTAEQRANAIMREFDLDSVERDAIIDAINVAAADMRERCAQVCDDWGVSIYPQGEDVDHETAQNIARGVAPELARAIRALEAR